MVARWLVAAVLMLPGTAEAVTRTLYASVRDIEQSRTGDFFAAIGADPVTEALVTVTWDTDAPVTDRSNSFRDTARTPYESVTITLGETVIALNAGSTISNPGTSLDGTPADYIEVIDGPDGEPNERDIVRITSLSRTFIEGGGGSYLTNGIVNAQTAAGEGDALASLAIPLAAEINALPERRFFLPAFDADGRALGSISSFDVTFSDTPPGIVPLPPAGALLVAGLAAIAVRKRGCRDALPFFGKCRCL